jgi:hypothetical protein
MSRVVSFVVDVVAITVLAFGIYFPRYRRRDLLISFISVNVGVLAVLVALSSTVIGQGVGIGLFGVLSIIRLRSTELAQEETGYYFAALALGLLGGVVLTDDWISPVLSGLILICIFLFDHPALLRSYRHQVMVLDRAFGDEGEMKAHLGDLLGAEIVRATVQRLDLVNDTTVVDVRYKVRSEGAAAEPLDERSAPVGLGDPLSLVR